MGGSWLDAPPMDRSSREQLDGNDRSFVDSRFPGEFQKPERRLILCARLGPLFSIRSSLAYGKDTFVQSPPVGRLVTLKAARNELRIGPLANSLCIFLTLAGFILPL